MKKSKKAKMGPIAKMKLSKQIGKKTTKSENKTGYKK